MSADSEESLVGQTLLGRFRLTGHLGRGGMSTVYEATDPGGARVAVKVLNGAVGRSHGARERFLRERRAADLIAHEAAVRVTDHGETPDGRLVLIMELLEGQTLRKRCETAGGSLAPAEALQIASHVLDVLSAAHDKRVFHRDIKPENIFLTSRGEVKVLDFGVAAIRDDGAQHADVTKSGATIGTPAFMAPEQARGHHAKVDARSDVWAVGATLYYCLTGRHVHATAQTANEALIFAATQSAPPIASVRSDLRRAIRVVVDRALAFSPEKRFQSAAAMRDAIVDATSAQEPETISQSSVLDTLDSPVSSRVAPQRPMRLLAVVSVASISVAVGTFVRYARNSPGVPTPSKVTDLLPTSTVVAGAGKTDEQSTPPAAPLASSIVATPPVSSVVTPRPRARAVKAERPQDFRPTVTPSEESAPSAVAPSAIQPDSPELLLHQRHLPADVEGRPKATLDRRK